MQIKNDFFLQKFLKVSCYTIQSFSTLKKLQYLQRPFFISYVNKKKLTKQDQLEYNCKYLSKLLIFQKNIKKKEPLKNNCRIAKNKDKKLIDRLVLKSETNSRFFLDKNIDNKKIKRFRADWVKSYFKNKRGKKLIVSEVKNKIKGILLVRFRKKIARIDIIVVDHSIIRKNIATSLISFFNNNFKNRFNVLIAGTQQTNIAAIKLYKKNNFKLIDYKYYHHIYSL